MGFRIPDHLLEKLYQQFNKTESDNAIIDRGIFSPTLDPWLPAENRLSIRARQQPLIKGIDMFNNDSFNPVNPVFNKLEDAPNFSVVKMIEVDKKIFELIATQHLRAIHVDSYVENNLSGGSMLIISCHDAAFITYISGFYESTLEPNKKLLEFELAFQPEPTAKI